MKNVNEICVLESVQKSVRNESTMEREWLIWSFNKFSKDFEEEPVILIRIGRQRLQTRSNRKCSASIFLRNSGTPLRADCDRR